MSNSKLRGERHNLPILVSLEHCHKPAIYERSTSKDRESYRVLWNDLYQENTEQKTENRTGFKLEDNYGRHRLKSLQVALQRNPEQCRCQSDDLAGVYYMPHAGVYPSIKVPLRMNFDACSKKKGKLPLIDDIEKSTSFINKIHDILLTSQTSKIVFKCDTEAAFTQVRLGEHHKDTIKTFEVLAAERYPNTFLQKIT
uniref:Reverse transcriptase domain-containing protein n=1 Tax=Haemonchus contortus TaxID=6289 RepID=A0A7I4Z422_HAECO